MPDEPFLELIRRIRGGEEDASAELVHRYADQIRRIVRVRLTDSRLRRVMDSQDICQSVLANFFTRASAGQFELETPDQLFKLLATMARNKLTNKAEYYQARRRDMRRIAGGDDALRDATDRDATPSVEMARAELVQICKSLLTDEERRLLDLRAEGSSWAEIAAEMDDNPERIRKRLARAIERIKAAWEHRIDGDV